MKRRVRVPGKAWPTAILATVLFVFAAAVSAATPGGTWQPATTGGTGGPDVSSSFCINYLLAPTSIAGPGTTNGLYGTPVVGEKFTFTAAGGGTGTWRIVGDSGGVQTLASGGTIPGTLTYIVQPGVTITGVGFYVDTYTGVAGPPATISGICQTNPPDIPTLSGWAQLALVLVLGSLGFVAFRIRRQG